MRRAIRRVRAIGGERLFLDAAPHSDSAALEAARIADLVLITRRPAILDPEAITDTLAFTRTASTLAPVVLNAIAATGQDAVFAAEALSAHDVETCPVWLGRRVAFARALLSGQSAQEFEPFGKAAVEVERLQTSEEETTVQELLSEALMLL